MTENAALAVEEDLPLRRDADGNPIYGEWHGVEESRPVGALEPGEWMVDYAHAPRPAPEIIYRQPAEVREMLRHNWDDFRRKIVAKGFDPEDLLAGVEKVYSTAETALFFGRSNQWVYWGLRETIFQYKDGSPILPERIGKNGRRRFTLPIIREIALSCYRRGQIQLDELHEIMAKILLEEFGPKAFADAS